jgi:hypothetical protein
VTAIAYYFLFDFAVFSVAAIYAATCEGEGDPPLLLIINVAFVDPDFVPLDETVPFGFEEVGAEAPCCFFKIAINAVDCASNASR